MKRTGGAGDIGEAFQQLTKHRRPGAQRPALRKGEQKSEGKVIRLAPADREAGARIWEVIAGRRSVRRFSRTPIGARELSTLLWASQGVTARTFGQGYRAAPSAGALYPVETYVIANRVEGLAPGLYRYLPEGHALSCLCEEALGEALARAALDQDMAREAGAVFVWTAVFERCTRRYEQRAYRYVYLETGHIAAHLALAAVALGLGSCQVAALYDDEVNAIIGADGVEESTIYMTVVGRPAGARTSQSSG